MSPYASAIFFEICMDSTLTRIQRKGEILVAVAMIAFPALCHQFIEEISIHRLACLKITESSRKECLPCSRTSSVFQLPSFESITTRIRHSYAYGTIEFHARSPWNKSMDRGIKIPSSAGEEAPGCMEECRGFLPGQAYAYYCSF